MNAPPKTLILGGALLLAVGVFCAFVNQPADLGSSDFTVFWAGAQLVGPDLYDAPKALAIQRSISPLADRRYVRPPVHAVALWLLGRLPFRTAYAVWQLVMLAAAVFFVYLWKPSPQAYVACAFYIPLLWNFGLGQDGPALLLLLAIGIKLVENGRDAQGGAVLALCLVKPHLFALLPFVLLRRRKSLTGFAACAIVLYAASAFAMGWDWPAAFAEAVASNERAIDARLLGLGGILKWAGVSGEASLAVALGIAVPLAVWLGRASDLRYAVAAVVLLGVAVFPHSLVYDGALALPFLLSSFPARAVPVVGLALATVVTPVAAIARFILLALAGVPVARRARSEGTISA